MNCVNLTPDHSTALPQSRQDMHSRRNLAVRRSAALTAVLILCVSTLFGAVPSFCQMAFNPERTGVIPYGTYEGTNLDKIDMSNGRVYLSIPLYALSQKGSLTLSFSAIVSGATTYNAQQGPCNQTTCQYNYELPTSNLTNNIGPNLIFDQSLRLLSVTPTPTHFIQASYESGEGETENSYMETQYIHRVMDGAGNLHYLGYDPSTNYETLRSADGSGYLEQLSDPNGYKDGATGPIYDAKGIRYDSTGITDPNGNHITYTSSSNIITDSLGRSVPLPWTGTAVAISNCPNLNNPNQPVTSAIEWDVPGPTDVGGTVKYYFCYTTFYYHTNFLFQNGASVEGVQGNPPIAQWYNEASGQVTAIQSIVNPDKTAWSFEYDGTQNSSTIAYGDLLKVHLPSGGTITYSYQTAPTCTPEEEGYPWGNTNLHFEPYSRVVSTRTLTQLDGTTKTWNYTFADATAASLTSTVGRPDGNSTVYQFSPLDGSECNYVETGRTDYQGSPTSGVVKRTTQTTYFAQQIPQAISLVQSSYYYAYNSLAGGNELVATDAEIPPQEIPFVHTVTTTIDQGTPVTTTYAYDAGLTNVQPWCLLEDDYNQNDCQWNMTSRTAASLLGRVTSVSTTGSDGHGGTLTSTKSTTYQAFSSSGITSAGYYNANLLDFPHVVSVNGSSTNVSTTTYNYDENNGSPVGVHGNLTSSNTNGGATITTVFNTQGMPTSNIDGNGGITTYSYADASSASPTTICLPPTNNGTVTHCSSYTWDPNTGEMLSYTDQNGVLTKYTYNDGFGRMTLTDAAVGTPSERKTLFSYTANVSSISADESVINDGKLKSSVTVDGFGRQIHSTDAAGATVDTTYDGVGNIASVSNPYFLTSDPTYGITSYTYDALGRKVEQIYADGNTEQWCYDGISAFTGQKNCVAHIGSGSGPWVDFTDENGNHWQRTSDALGHLTEAIEDASGAKRETDYQYDNLSNLTSVTQWGGASGGPNPVKRTFSYDSLSHLVQAFNPESGWVCYGTTPSNAPANGTNCTEDYDGNGNLKAKTDAKGVQVTYTYDSLNRLQWKHYTDGITIAAGFGYDGYDATGNAVSGETYAKGRLSQVSEAAAHSISIFSYDPMGRVIKKESCIPGDCNYDVKVNATYDLAGDLATLSNGSPTQPITLSYKYDTAGRLSSITSSWTGTNHPSTVFEANSTSPASYGPAGLQYALLGGTTSSAATVILSRAYDNRLRPVYEGDTNSADAPLYSYCVPGPNNSHCTSSSSGYAPNGNVQQFSDSVMGNWTFQSPGYDTLNRLVNGAATTGPYANKYGCWQYDAFGNRTSEAVSTTPCPQSPTPLSWAHYNANNQISATGLMPNGYLYDAAGNVMNDGVNQYLYDAEDRVCAVKSDTTGAMTGYIYDGAGDRVGKGTVTSFSCNLSSNGFVTTSGYVVGLNGEQLTETNGGTGWLHTHVYANGKLLATYTSSDTLFELSDWLGTKRADVGVSGCETTWQSLPWGNALTSSGNCSGSSELHFTGKERDQESGNDYFGARYYGSSMGRFLSPDPSQLYFADPTNPQSFNLYAYVYNNPLINIDPTGTDACAYDIGDGTATIYNAVDGGAVDCPGNGFYINTTQQVTAVGFDGNGDLSVYGADGNLYNPDGSDYVASQTVTVNANGDSSFIPTQTINSPGIQYIVSRPAQYSFGPTSEAADVCAASALLHNGLNTGLDTLGAVPVLGSWGRGAKAAVQGVQLVGGVVSAAAATTGTLAEGASAGAGLGLTGAANTLPKSTVRLAGDTVEIIPFVGNILSATNAVNDIYGKDGMVNYYNACMAGTN